MITNRIRCGSRGRKLTLSNNSRSSLMYSLDKLALHPLLIVNKPLYRHITNKASHQLIFNNSILSIRILRARMVSPYSKVPNFTAVNPHLFR